MIHEPYTGTKTSVFVSPQVHRKPMFSKISTLKLVMVTFSFTGHSVTIGQTGGKCSVFMQKGNVRAERECQKS